MGNYYNMKLRVLRDFYDTTADRRLRLRGTIYDEPNKKRATKLANDEFVQMIDPPIEQPTGKPEMETKKPRGKNTTTKKSTPKKSTK